MLVPAQGDPKFFAPQVPKASQAAEVSLPRDGLESSEPALELLPKSLPPSAPDTGLEKAQRILQNSSHYRAQVGGDYLKATVAVVPKDFHPWLEALQPEIMAQAGDQPQLGRDPFNLMALQMKPLSLAALMAETQAQMAQAKGQVPDRKALLSQELDFQFRAQAYCQVAGLEDLQAIQELSPPAHANYSGRWFCEQLGQRLGAPPQLPASPLQAALQKRPELLQKAPQLEGTAASWTQVLTGSNEYLAHIQDVAQVEQQALTTWLEANPGQSG